MKYIVWLRNDGLIAASNGHMPQDYQGADGSQTTFIKLSEHETWENAYDAIVLERHNRKARP